MKCLYHVDWDGVCSAYFVAKYFNNFNPDNYIRINYGYDLEPIFKRISKDEKVVIVDFSLDPEKMRDLYNITKDIIWIDHHYTSLKKYEDFEIDLPGLRYDGIAGCLLTYSYFFEMNMGKNKPFDPNMYYSAPWFAKYIGDQDIWKFEFGDDTRHFRLALDIEESILPTDKNFFESLTDERSQEMIQEGIICEKYRDSMAKRAMKSSFEFQFGEYKALCLNGFGNSKQFGDKINEYDLVCLFHYTGKIWTYTFYASSESPVDVSKVATSFEGTKGYISAGGHRKAAGLQHQHFLFN